MQPKQHALAMILGAVLCAPALSQSDSSSTDLANKFFSSENPTLTPAETGALEFTKRWAAGSPPLGGPNGSVRYLFGAQQPSIVCAVLQVCDVSLQAGEQVQSIHLGDSVRWMIDPAITGSGDREVQHLIIKPMDVGLETSLVVTTDRRTYHMRLRSHRTDYMAQVAFSYPEEAALKWDALRLRGEQKRQEKIIPQTGEYLPTLSFDYELEGGASWKPVRVYNNGVKTVIEMPQSMVQTDAPTLMVVTKDGGAFGDDETAIVNYRLQGSRFIVDSIFDKAILIAGVGDRQDRVTIIRKR